MSKCPPCRSLPHRQSCRSGLLTCSHLLREPRPGPTTPDPPLSAPPPEPVLGKEPSKPERRREDGRRQLSRAVHRDRLPEEELPRPLLHFLFSLPPPSVITLAAGGRREDGGGASLPPRARHPCSFLSRARMTGVFDSLVADMHSTQITASSTYHQHQQPPSGGGAGPGGSNGSSLHKPQESPTLPVSTATDSSYYTNQQHPAGGGGGQSLRAHGFLPVPRQRPQITSRIQPRAATIWAYNRRLHLLRALRDQFVPGQQRTWYV